jgi:ketosteroid isomerase-like protein
MKTVGELFADDIVWHNGGRGPFAGDLRSKKEVFELFGELAERSGGTFSIDIHGVVGGDEHVVVLSTSHATTNGRSIESQSADIWHVRDGKAVELWHLDTDAYAAEEFWA